MQDLSQLFPMTQAPDGTLKPDWLNWRPQFLQTAQTPMSLPAGMVQPSQLPQLKAPMVYPQARFPGLGQAQTDPSIPPGFAMRGLLG